jgi:hypothetical protein
MTETIEVELPGTGEPILDGAAELLFASEFRRLIVKWGRLTMMPLPPRSRPRTEATARGLTADMRPVQARGVPTQMLSECALLGRVGDRCEQFLAELVRQPSRQGDREPLSPGTVKHAWDVLRRVLRHLIITHRRAQIQHVVHRPGRPVPAALDLAPT